MTEQPHVNEPTIASTAPVVSAHEIEIDAPIDRVWGVLTAIDRWPAWNPDVKSVWIDSPVAEGVTFRWKAGPGTITSRIEHLDRPRLVVWSGRTLGIRAIHVWRFEARDGNTLARTEESYDGLVARVLRRSLQKMLDTALTDGAGYLKTEAEKPSPAAS
jgi:Polyketide cyclase / dehydrase and lipid transport